MNQFTFPLQGASVELTQLSGGCFQCEEGACGAATAVAWDAAEESVAVGTSSGWVLVYALEADQPPLRRLKLQERHAVRARRALGRKQVRWTARAEGLTVIGNACSIELNAWIHALVLHVIRWCLTSDCVQRVCFARLGYHG